MPFTSSPIGESRKRRVAAYARVSTDHDEQFTSYEAQIDYYTKYIEARSDWDFVKVYTDEGITGTSTKHREGSTSCPGCILTAPLACKLARFSSIIFPISVGS